MEYKNILKFTEWYKEKAKEEYSKFFIVNDLLEEVTLQFYITGEPKYELNKFESKSGKTETYKYKVHENRDLWTDEYKYTIIF